MVTLTDADIVIGPEDAVSDPLAPLDAFGVPRVQTTMYECQSPWLLGEVLNYVGPCSFDRENSAPSLYRMESVKQKLLQLKMNLEA